MSKISTLYDAMVTRVSAVLTAHTRIANPYKTEENATIYLKKGWGLAVLDANATDKQVNCYLDYDRTFQIVITRQFYSLENDPVSKSTTEKDLLEDSYLVMKDLAADPDLGTTAVAVLNFVGDGGLEYIFSETDKFLKIALNYRAHILENLN